MDFNDQYVKQVFAFFQERNFEEALKILEDPQKIPPNAEIHQMIETTKVQIDLQKKARQSAKNEAELQAKISRDLYGITDNEKAIEEYTTVFNRNPNDDQAKHILAFSYYIRGLTLESEGEDKLAIEAYNEAIKINPDFPKAITKRGYASRDTCDYDQAIEDFEKMIQFHPDDPQWKKTLASVYCDRGIACETNGDYTNAVKDYEKALDFDPDNSQIRELWEMAKAEIAKK